MSSNEAYEILKFSLEHFDKEVETHIESLKNESKMLSELLKKNLQSELLNLPNSIRKMTMEEFLQHCLDIDTINVNSVPAIISNTKDNNNNNSTENQNQGDRVVSLTELLFSPEKNTNEIDNNNNNNYNNNNNNSINNSPDNESMIDIKQKVINILNSPQLILKKKGFNNK
ncbi:hypothetical protein ACTA71_011864 [Dictyostelium dimigraforme]